MSWRAIPGRYPMPSGWWHGSTGGKVSSLPKAINRVGVETGKRIERRDGQTDEWTNARMRDIYRLIYRRIYFYVNTSQMVDRLDFFQEVR